MGAAAGMGIMGKAPGRAPEEPDALGAEPPLVHAISAAAAASDRACGAGLAVLAKQGHTLCGCGCKCGCGSGSR
jgi:hypothetical protein